MRLRTLEPRASLNHSVPQLSLTHRNSGVGKGIPKRKKKSKQIGYHVNFHHKSSAITYHLYLYNICVFALSPYHWLEEVLVARKLAPRGLFTSGSGSSLADASRGSDNDRARGSWWGGAPSTSDGPSSDNHFFVSDNHDDDVDDAGSMPSVPGSKSRRRTYGGYGWAGQGPGPSSVRTRCPPPPSPCSLRCISS